MAMVQAYPFLGAESGGRIPVRFLVGDEVEVLNACRLPKIEEAIGRGVVERISDGPTVLYWVSGFPCARTANVLRLVKRGRA